MNNRLSLILRFILFSSFGLLLVWLIIIQMTEEDFQEIRESFREANYIWIILILFFDFFSNVSRAIRWQILMEPLGKKPGFLVTFSAVCIGNITNLALPRVGEILRCSVIKKYENLPMNKTLGTVIAERVIDIASLFILIVAVVFIQFEILNSYVTERILIPLHEIVFTYPFEFLLISGLISALIISMIIYFFYEKNSSNSIFLKIKQLLSGFFEGMKTFKKIKKPGGFWFHTFIIWITNIAVIIVGFKAFEATYDLGFTEALVVLVFGIIGYMVIQGGIGIVPIITMEVLELYGLSKSVGFALGWILWAAGTISIIFYGVLSVIVLPIIKKIKN